MRRCDFNKAVFSSAILAAHRLGGGHENIEIQAFGRPGGAGSGVDKRTADPKS